MTYPIQGSCQCGSVKYTLLAAPQLIQACHCLECQKLSTSAFSVTAVVNASSIKFEGEMQEWRRPADSGNISAAKFCPTCGNRIYHFNPAEPDAIKLKPSTLSDTSIIKPTRHIWVSQKQHWYQIPEGVVTFEKQGA
ncbi:GFA family protein [Amphritea sp. 1_MG-2023]|uniref:GFA family protein n=1 Tax=Amphritea sp. 1_MG-2023 TaxID=3062670 RepID=UPI0026E3D70B|nr:GFA family protein [Amphritea sp. 1_MG-2023]MDO6564254.1 GFA family protein [Amphritea sp. 1_MG-2023]